MRKDGKKTKVLTLSRVFLRTHPKAGQPTGFEEKYKAGIKKHTMRINLKHWCEVEQKVNAGDMVLCVRQWTGKPYNSKQRELFTLTRVRVQEFDIEWWGDALGVVRIDGRPLSQQEIEKLAANDGLSFEDWLAWMCPTHKDIKGGAILHFTDELKY